MIVDRIVVFGAGAIGSLYAAKLASRHPVAIVGRQDHVDAIKRNGLRIIGHEELTERVDASTELGAIGPKTLVVLATKVNGNDRAADALSERACDDTVILCVQNGLNGEEIVKARLPGRTLVLRAITQCGAIFREPGVIDYRVAGPTLIEASPVSAAVAGLLSACGLDGRVSEDIRREIWKKLIFNCVINPITSIVGTEVGGIKDPRLDPLKRLVIEECLTVAGCDNAYLGMSVTDLLLAITEIFGASKNIASMRQDLLKGKPTEIDHLNGAVVRLGARHGIECPVNAALVAIIMAMESRAPSVIP